MGVRVLPKKAPSIADPRALSRVIRDPVHGYVLVPHELEELLGHRLVQRMRRIGRTSLTSSVYPSMSGNRYEHALGAMHLSREAWSRAWLNSDASVREQFQDEVHAALTARDVARDACTKRWVHNRAKFENEFEYQVGLAIGAVALLHDLGHTPFSHALEDFFERHLGDVVLEGDFEATGEWESFRARLGKSSFHEVAGLRLLAQIPATYHADLPWALVGAIARDFGSGSWSASLHGLVAGEVDIDKLDYLLRDAARCGTEFGAIDHARLLHSLELHLRDDGGGWQIGLGLRARSAVESFLTQRLQYYRWVGFHPSVVAMNAFLEDALELLVELGTAGASDRRTHEVFARLRPNLNYVAPTSASTRKILARYGATPAELARLSSERQLDEQSAALQAEVDDSTVIEWMKAAASVGRAMVDDDGLAGRVRKPLVRYLALYEAVVHNAPNWVPAWKTEEAYEDVAHRLAQPLSAALRAVLGALVARSEAGTGADLSLATAARKLKKILGAIQDDPLVGMNRLAHLLMDGETKAPGYATARGMSERLTALTASAMGSWEGFWRIAYAQTAPYGAGESGVPLFDGNEPFAIAASSPLIQSLAAVEEKRIQLFAYYVTPHAAHLQGVDLATFAVELRDRFVERFPAVVEGVLSSNYLDT
jgi:HD superfamily phosphohydrolase